jgi:hypothetical protein
MRTGTGDSEEDHYRIVQDGEIQRMQHRIAEQHEIIQRILSEKQDLASAYLRLQEAITYDAQRLGAAQVSQQGAGRDAGVASIDVDSVGARPVGSSFGMLDQLNSEQAARQAAERELRDERQQSRELALQLEMLSATAKISDAAAAAVDSALAVLGREDRAEHAGLVQELRRAQLEIAELRAAHASSPTRGARAAGWIGQASPAHGEMVSPGTASEVARLHEALEQARQAHAEELRVCEAEQLARVAAEQTLSEREAATKSMLAARDGELARMHEQIVRLHEQLDSAHVAYVAAQTAANENARGAGGTLVASAVSRDACVMMGEAASAGCAWRGHGVCGSSVAVRGMACESTEAKPSMCTC